MTLPLKLRNNISPYNFLPPRFSLLKLPLRHKKYLFHLPTGKHCVYVGFIAISNWFSVYQRFSSCNELIIGWDHKSMFCYQCCKDIISTKTFQGVTNIRTTYWQNKILFHLFRNPPTVIHQQQPSSGVKTKYSKKSKKVFISFFKN